MHNSWFITLGNLKIKAFHWKLYSFISCSRPSSTFLISTVRVLSFAIYLFFFLSFFLLRFFFFIYPHSRFRSSWMLQQRALFNYFERYPRNEENPSWINDAIKFPLASFKTREELWNIYPRGKGLPSWKKLLTFIERSRGFALSQD